MSICIASTQIEYLIWNPILHDRQMGRMAINLRRLRLAVRFVSITEHILQPSNEINVIRGSNAADDVTQLRQQKMTSLTRANLTFHSGLA